MIFMDLYWRKFAGLVEVLGPGEQSAYPPGILPSYTLEALTAADVEHFQDGTRELVPYTIEHAGARYGDVYDGERFTTPELTPEDRVHAADCIAEDAAAKRRAIRQAALETVGDVMEALKDAEFNCRSVLTKSDAALAVLARAKTKWDVPELSGHLGNGKPPIGPIG